MVERRNASGARVGAACDHQERGAAIIRSTGSRLALYLSEDGLAPERLDSVLRTTQD